MSVTKTKPKIDIRYFGSIKDQNSTEAQAIKSIMIACDNDFVPPLSHREDASKPLGVQKSPDDITPYWLEIIAQENIVAQNKKGDIVAFMSFKNKYQDAEKFSGVVKDGDTINYISTICVLHDYRRLGIASRFYDWMEVKLPRTVRGECISTRTWSTNNGHILWQLFPVCLYPCLQYHQELVW